MKKLNYHPVHAARNSICVFAITVLLLSSITPAKVFASRPEWKIFTPAFSYNKGVRLDQIVRTKGITDVVKGNDGTIWLACEDSYPLSIRNSDKKEFVITPGDPERFRTMDYVPSYRSQFVKCFNGQIWLITGQNIICMKDTLSDWEGLNILSGKKSPGNTIPVPDFDALGDIATDKSGNIWITGVSKTKVKAGLAKLSGDKWVYYAVPQEMIDATFTASSGKKIQLITGGDMAYSDSPELQTLFSDLNFDAEGNIWMRVGRNNDRGVCKFREGVYKLFTLKNNNLPSDIIRDIASDEKGVIHIATDKSLIVMNPNDGYSAFNQDFTPVAMTFDIGNKLWWSSSSPGLPTSPIVTRYDPSDGGSFEMTANNTPLSDEVKKIYIDDSENIYFITSEKAPGLYILYNNQIPYPGWEMKDSFQSGSTAMLRYSLTAGLNDKDWNFYGVSEFRGLRHLIIFKDGKWEQSQFALINDSKGLLFGGYDVNAITRNSAGDFFLGTNNYIYKYDKNAANVEGYDKSKMSKTVNCMASDQAGNMWIGTTKGLAKYNGTNFTYFDTKTSLLPGNLILNLLVDKNSRVWIGTPDGLLCIDKEKQTVYDKKNGLKTQRIVGLAQDSKGRVFIATSNFNSQSEFIYIEENGTLTMEPLPDVYTIGSMVFDRNDNLWIGCENILLCRGKDGKYVSYDSKNSPLLYAYRITDLFVVGDEIWLKLYTAPNSGSGSSSSAITPGPNTAPVSKENEILNSLRPRLAGLNPDYFTIVFKPGV